MALVQVNGTKLYRDTETMALINKDISGAQEYQAKRKFAVYPSAYANGWLVRTYKSRGGGYR